MDIVLGWTPHLLFPVWMLFALRWSIRRLERIGCCPRCGYDLAGGSGGRCPECGHVIGAAVSET